MSYKLLCLSLLASLLLPSWVQAEKGKASRVALPGIRCHQGVDAGVGQVLGDLVLEALLNRHSIRAMGPTDVIQLLKAEEQRKLLGCDDENCLVEMAGVMGADWLIGGSVGKLDDVYVLSLMLIDSKEGRVTSRSSKTIEKLKEAPALVGPMVDKLLGSKARPQPPVAALDRPDDEALTQKPWSLTEHKRKFVAYRDSLVSGPFDGKALAEARRAMLEDLVVEVMPQDFKSKRIIMFSYSGALEAELSRQKLSSTTDEAVLDARRRLNEWWVFKKQMEKVEYAYERGLKMEEKGSGNRLSKLPFPVEPAVLSVPVETKIVKDYMKAWPEGQKVLVEALGALQKKDYKAFEALWTTEAKGRKNFIKSEYGELLRRLGQGFSYRTCRQSMLSSGEIDRKAGNLKRLGKLYGCIIKMKKNSASSFSPRLQLEGGVWRIYDW